MSPESNWLILSRTSIAATYYLSPTKHRLGNTSYLYAMHVVLLPETQRKIVQEHRVADLRGEGESLPMQKKKERKENGKKEKKERKKALLLH